MCGPHRRFAPLLSRTLRRIPQAVGVVATLQARPLSAKCFWLVSIPQAIGVVATVTHMYQFLYRQVRFNTAGGRCCCNRMR